jgi:16S rRNA processing protein RimM
VDGEALVEIYTDFPDRLRAKRVVYAGEAYAPLTIRSSRYHNDGLLLAFEGIETPEQIGLYRNQILYVSTADRQALPEGEYYFDQLIGLDVEDEGRRSLGRLTEILQTGANDVYVVTGPSGQELLLPAIAEVILAVDLPNRVIRVHLLPGLADEKK